MKNITAALLISALFAVNITFTGCGHRIVDSTLSKNPLSQTTTIPSKAEMYKYKGLEQKGTFSDKFCDEEYYYVNYDSEITECFIAIKDSKDGGWLNANFMCFDDGKGIAGPFDEKEKIKENTFDFGYMKGKKVDASKFDIDYKKWSDPVDLVYGYNWYFDIDISEDEGRTGLLFLEISINGEKYDRCFPSVMVDGKVQVRESLYLYDDKTKVKDVQIKPVYFCEASPIDSSEFFVEEDMNNNKVSISKRMSFYDNRKGCLLSEYKAVNGTGKEYEYCCYDKVNQGKVSIRFNIESFWIKGNDTLPKEETKDIEIQREGRYFFVPVYDY